MLKATLTIVDEAVTVSSVISDNVILHITQGATLWEADGLDHVKPKSGKTVDAPYLELGSQPPSNIEQDANNRFVTDTEKSTWNGKLAPDGTADALTFTDTNNHYTANNVKEGLVQAGVEIDLVISTLTTAGMPWTV